MVLVSVHALQNLNHGIRNFPHSGYLGLTKTLVQGIVRTRIEDDHKLMAASRVTISVKCYEIRSRFTHSRVNILVDVTHVLWSNPSLTHECADIGDLDLPFRLVLPADTAGPSTLNFPDYKIFWRLEAGECNFCRIGFQWPMAGCRTLCFRDVKKPNPRSRPSSSSHQ